MEPEGAQVGAAKRDRVLLARRRRVDARDQPVTRSTVGLFP